MSAERPKPLKPRFAVRMRNSFDAYYSSDMKPTGSSDPRKQGRHHWGSQLPVCSAGHLRESPSVAFAIMLRVGATGGHMLPVDLFSYCECLAHVFLHQDLTLRNNRDEIDKVGQSNYSTTAILLTPCSMCSIQNRMSPLMYVP